VERENFKLKAKYKLPHLVFDTHKKTYTKRPSYKQLLRDISRRVEVSEMFCNLRVDTSLNLTNTRVNMGNNAPPTLSVTGLC
jgi:HEPN domain-containing protein